MKLKFSDSTYTFLKWFCLVFLPALGVFISTVGPVFNMPYVEEIKTFCFALGTLIGSCIGVSSLNYYADLEVHDE